MTCFPGQNDNGVHLLPVLTVHLLLHDYCFSIKNSAETHYSFLRSFYYRFTGNSKIKISTMKNLFPYNFQFSL